MRRLLAILGLLCAGLLAVLVAWPPAGAPEPGGEVGEEAAAPAGPSLADAAADAVREDVPAAAPAVEGGRALASGAGGHLQGLVLDHEGRPIPGAWVVSLWEGRPLRCDAAGAFSMQLDSPAGPGAQRTLQAWATDRSLAAARVVTGEPARIVLELARPLELTVEDRDGGQALAGARVTWLVQATARPGSGPLALGRWIALPAEIPPTDAEGHTLLPDDHGGWVRVEAPGRPPVVTRVGRWNHRILVPGRWERYLRLVADGEPLAGVQVAFPRASGTQTTDDAGRVLLPPETGGDLAWTEVALGEGRFWVLCDPESLAPRRQAVIEEVVDHEPRRGRVVLPPGLAPEEVEVATVAVAALSGMGTTWHPDPRDEPDRLDWRPLQAGGAFELLSGWQGAECALVLRRATGGPLLHIATLEGGGPYVVTVPARHTARLTFLCRPTALLAGARAILVRTGPGWQEQDLTSLALDEQGVAVAELEAGTWLVRLRLRGETDERPVGVLEMPEAPHEQSFDLGPLREVRGQVLAAGAPVFPGTVRLRGADGAWRATARLDERGRFRIRAAPAGELQAEVMPADAWLEAPTRTTFRVPPGAGELRLILPAATLRLSLDAVSPPDPASVFVERFPLPEDGGDGWSRRPRLPVALARGPVELRVAPGRYRFGVTEDLQVLRRAQVSLEDGSDAGLVLAVVDAGRVEILVRGLDGACVASRLQFSPRDGGLDGARARSPGLLGPRAGRVVPPHDLAPGRWRLDLAGPFRGVFGAPELSLPAGPWTLDFEIGAGEQLDLILEPDEEGRWRLVEGSRTALGGG